MVKVKLNVPPLAAMGVLMPESNVVLSSLVTVWGTLVVFVQVTVVPTLMVMVAGLNAKEPVVVIETAIAVPDDVAVAVGVLPTGAVVGVGVEPPPVDPPQAAITIMAASASRTYRVRMAYRFE